jgi:hypothetical protein
MIFVNEKLENMEPKDYIQQYLTKTNLGICQFARLCDISSTSVYKYLAGAAIARKEAEKIEKYTNGGILYENLCKRKRKISKSIKSI